MFTRFRLYPTAAVFTKMLRSKSGNFGIITALIIPVLLATAGGSVDFGHAHTEKARLQTLLDSAILAAAAKVNEEAQRKEAKAFLADKIPGDQDIDDLVSVKKNDDGSITGTFDGAVRTPFLSIVGIDTLPISVTSTAIAKAGTPTNAACIYVLGNKSQAVLINAGANVKSERCGVQVHSTSNPAYIMNSGAVIDTAKFCVKGTQSIKNGGTLTNVEHGCAALPDPYAGKMPEPTVPSTCTTSGTRDGQTITMSPGLHCGTTFNGSPKITFLPGLHIIRDRMIINSNATVIAEGVTFYFPNVNSEIRANGGITFTGKAPTTGTYKGILMFEKTSDASNNTNKQQYIFGGSKGEVLEGIIYLPNRDVTYNSTTNQVNKIALVVNTMIMNSSKWLLEPYTGGGSGAGSAATVRLVR